MYMKFIVHVVHELYYLIVQVGNSSAQVCKECIHHIIVNGHMLSICSILVGVYRRHQ